VETKLTFSVGNPALAAALATAANMLWRNDAPIYSPETVCFVIKTILDSARVDANLPQDAINTIAEDCSRFISLAQESE